MADTEMLVEVAKRFWAKVDRQGEDECWRWLGAQASTGYGRYFTNRKGRPAQQVAWELTNGQPFPEGKNGCHSCDNPICVNPKHIWPGTQSENIRDAMAKGRYHYPTKTHCKYGHELSQDNRMPSQDGTRCRTCQRTASRENMRRKRAAIRARSLAHNTGQE